MFEQTFKNIDDVLYKDAGADSELDYIGQTSWILFLRYLDELEHKYELTYGFKPGHDDEMIDMINKILNHKNIHGEWQKRREKMLSEKIDFNKWMIDYFKKIICIVKQ